jgi:hypothetical protein
MKLFIRSILLFFCVSIAARAQDRAPAPEKESPPIASTAPQTEPLRLQATDKDGLKGAIGKTATVTGRVQRANAWDGGITFLNLEGGFTVVCFKKHYGEFPSPPDQLYAQGKTIEVTGKIRLHKERPEIEITGPEQIKVLADAPAPPSEPAADKPEDKPEPAEEEKQEKPGKE